VIANAAPLTTLLAQGRGAPDLTDGKLDITWLTADNADNNAVLGLAELVLAGLTNISLNAISQHYSARRIKIRRQDGEAVQYVIDGELYSDSVLEITVVPASLQVMLADGADSTQVAA